MKQFLELGKLINTHGIKGEMKLDYWCDDISYLKQLKLVYLDDSGNNHLTLLSVRPQKNNAIVKFSEITSIEQAEDYKNKIIYCNRDDAEIDDEANYIADLIGCAVVDVDTNENYGAVFDVVNYGASDILDVVFEKKHRFVPVIEDVVKSVDINDAVIKIKYMKGLFDED